MRFSIVILLMMVAFVAQGQRLFQLERADTSNYTVVTNSDGVQRYVTIDSLQTLLSNTGSYTNAQIDSITALLVRYTDTSAMLEPYITELEVYDTLGSYYLSTQVDSADGLRVLYTDTSSMLVSYITEAEVNDTLSYYYTSTLTNQIINDSLNVVRVDFVDSLNVLRSERDDTLSIYYTESQVDSADGLRVLYTDTAAMLLPYSTTLEARAEINDTANVLRSERTTLLGSKTDTTDFNALELAYNPNSQPILNKHYRAVDQQTIYIEEINNAAQGVSRLLNTTLSSGRNAYQDAEVVWMADNSDSTVTYSNKGADFTLTRSDSTYSINNEGDIYIWYRDYANIDFNENKQKAALLMREAERIELGNYFVYPVSNAPSQEIEIEFTGATQGTIYWGDGDVTTGYTSGTSVTHNYSPNYTGLIIIEFDSDVSVTEIGALTTSYSEEDIGNLPSSLTFYRNQGINTTSGDIGNLPSSLTIYRNLGINTTSGDIGNLPYSLTLYYNIGSNTTSGDIGNLPSLLTLYLNTGSNTTSGDIGNLPSSLTYYYNVGSNTTSGDIGNLPSLLTFYRNLGSNTTSGDIGNLPSSLTFYYNTGSNTVSDYTSKVWPSNMQYFLSLPTSGSGLSTSEVDQLLIDFAATTWTSSRFIDISGNNAARSSASDAAVTSLTTAGVTVITN